MKLCKKKYIKMYIFFILTRVKKPHTIAILGSTTMVLEPS